MEERLQKILSKCGIASRRKAEEMILEGLVRVNGVTATLGMKADLERDHIKVGGKLISSPQKKVYLMFNKPEQCLTSSDESEERTTVKDFLKRLKIPVFPVGRLDYNSEGLLLLTNDGDFANAILHPKSKIPKTYRVKINGMLGDKSVGQLERGVRLEDGKTAPARVRTVTKLAANSWIDITIHEGKKRQVRRMLQRVGHPVIKLKRIRINGLPLGNLKPGEFRHLTGEELDKLMAETRKQAKPAGRSHSS